MKKESKKIKVKKESHTEEIKRYIGAVTEDFQHKVSAIAEQVSGFQEKFDKEMEEVKAKQDMQTEMIGGMAVDIEILKEDIKEVKSDIVELKTDMKEVKNILKDKADIKKVVSFDSRLSHVEKMQKA